ncbi:MAG: hypothetical protein IPP48_06520 [Chitinophagaceae bacterium]|nr:hypothetical protein [Chitinophagaceae bacterium]
MFYKNFFLVLLILVTAGNLCIYVNRNNYSFVKQSTYAQIYPNYNLSTIKKFNKINDSTLEVVLNKTNKKLTDESKIIKLQKGVNAYKIAGASSTDSITIAVEYFATEDYAKQGNSLNGGITIYNTPLPQATQLTDLSKWRDDEITVSPQEEVALKQLLKDSMGITESESTINKVKKIGTYLSYKLRNAAGLPTDSLLRLSVFNQYKSGLNGVKIWCGNYANIFNLFAKNAGIKTRYVEINKTVNGFAGTCIFLTNTIFPSKKNGLLLIYFITMFFIPEVMEL